MTPTPEQLAEAEKIIDMIDNWLHGQVALELAVAAALAAAEQRGEDRLRNTIGRIAKACRAVMPLHPDLDTRRWMASNVPSEIGTLVECLCADYAAAFERGREEAALKVEEQGRLLKAIFETNGYDALIGDLAKAIRACKTEGATDD